MTNPNIDSQLEAIYENVSPLGDELLHLPTESDQWETRHYGMHGNATNSRETQET